MATLHVDHYRDDLSWVRQADVAGKRQHVFKHHGAATRVQVLEWS